MVLTGIRRRDIPPPNALEIGASICAITFCLMVGADVVLKSLGRDVCVLGSAGESLSYTSCPLLAAMHALGYRRRIAARGAAPGGSSRHCSEHSLVRRERTARASRHTLGRDHCMAWHLAVSPCSHRRERSPFVAFR
jgi:hypothetical protein